MWGGTEGNVNVIARQRMNLIAVAIADYQRVHGSRPKALAELVPVYFSALPIDPWTARDFIYEPEGVDVHMYPEQDRAVDVSPGTAFLASGGIGDAHFAQTINPMTGQMSLAVVINSQTSLQQPDNMQRNGVRFPHGVIFPGPMRFLR